MPKRKLPLKWIPDFRNTDAYPKPDTTLEQIAWEFLRRNRFYQSQYEILSKYPDVHELKAFRRTFEKEYLLLLSLRKDLSVDTIRGIIKHKREEFLTTYWLHGRFSKRLDPAVNKHPKFAPLKYPVSLTPIVAGAFPINMPNIFEYPCERVLKLSLADDIDQQLKGVKTALKDDIIDNADKLNLHQLRKDYLPSNTETYVLYLRILDAEASGIPFNMLDKCVDILDAIGSDKRSFDEIYDTATSLTDSGYRFILKAADTTLHLR